MTNNNKINVPISIFYRLLLMVVLITGILAAQVSTVKAVGSVLYVQPAGLTSGSCDLWANACELQYALSLAASGDELWVAQGTYYPTSGTSRTESFSLLNGVGIYGGFDATETLLTERDPVANVTILSGDIGTISDNSDNSYHVVVGGGTDSSALLDGFTITAGNANLLVAGGTDQYGGGMYNLNSSPTLSNLIFEGNNANYGAAMFNNNSNPTLTKIIFRNNSAKRGAGMYQLASNPTLTNVTFYNNAVIEYGGGMSNSGSSPVLMNVTFDGNSAYYGGGISSVYDSYPTLTNVTFSGNSATNQGGAMYSYQSSPVLKNITISGNSATSSGGGILNTQGSNPNITNSILYGNTGGEIVNLDTSTPTISDSVIQGGFVGGTNIIITDPMLGALGDNGGFTKTIALGVGSSAINAGGVNSACESTDQRGTSRPQGAACDIGAYEFDGVTTLTVSAVTDTYGNTVNLTATLESYETGVSGKTISFTLNGVSKGSAVTSASGVATLNSVVLDINVGDYPGGANSGVGASFAATGDPIFVASSDTDTLTISKRAITVTAVTDTKEYDGNAISTMTPSITSGSLASGDSGTWSQTFDNKNVGNNKVLTPSGSVTDGNGGANYTVTFSTVSTGVITTKGLTVSGITANNKEYNGNTTASLNLDSATLNGKVGSEDVTLNTGSAIGAFDTKHVGTGKTVTISGLTLGGSDAGNYSLTQPTTTANITVRSITVTAVTDTKTYDGTTGSSAVPSITSGSLGSGDSAGWTQSFDTKHIGEGKTLTPSGSVTDGNSGNNYSVTFIANATGEITARSITVTAVTDTKAYDGTTSSSKIPTITSGSLAAGDSATWTQSFDTADIGTNKTLTPSGSVSDGNSGNNYIITLASIGTGVITSAGPTFDDVPNTHPYFNEIEILYANGYTGGCSTSPLLFCPDVSMSRAQSAVFMLRGNFGNSYVPVTPTHFFKDNWKNSAWGEGWAESMYIEGLTAGCSPSPLKFCPDEILTNVQLAVFGLRLKHGISYPTPTPTGTVFADMTDTGFWGTGWAEQAYAEGLIPSCGTDVGTGLPMFCPNALVSRGFGASVIVASKGLTMP